MYVCKHCGHWADAGRVDPDNRDPHARKNARPARIWPLWAWAEEMLRRAERWDELRVFIPSMCVLGFIVAVLPFCAWRNLVSSMCFLTLAVFVGLYFGAVLNGFLRVMISRARR